METAENGGDIASVILCKKTPDLFFGVRCVSACLSKYPELKEREEETERGSKRNRESAYWLTELLSPSLG